MSTERKYDDEFKKQAVKLAKEVGTKVAVAELCIPKSTLLAWVRNANNGLINTGLVRVHRKNRLTLHSSFKQQINT